MYVLEICLFLIVLIAGISATITDLKNSIISNKMIEYSFIYFVLWLFCKRFDTVIFD